MNFNPNLFSIFSFQNEFIKNLSGSNFFKAYEDKIAWAKMSEKLGGILSETADDGIELLRDQILAPDGQVVRAGSASKEFVEAAIKKNMKK